MLVYTMVTPKSLRKTHTICTWQSMNILLKNTKNSVATQALESSEDVVCIMVDEVHMAKADALTTLLTGVMSLIPHTLGTNRYSTAKSLKTWVLM